MYRIARQRRTHQSWERNVKDCKAEAETAVQSWETHVKDCKRHAVQSWETNVKDCRAEQLGHKCEGLQARGGERRHMQRKEGRQDDTMTNKKGDNTGDKK